MDDGSFSVVGYGDDEVGLFEWFDPDLFFMNFVESEDEYGDAVLEEVWNRKLSESALVPDWDPEYVASFYGCLDATTGGGLVFGGKIEPEWLSSYPKKGVIGRLNEEGDIPPNCMEESPIQEVYRSYFIEQLDDHNELSMQEARPLRISPRKWC